MVHNYILEDNAIGHSIYMHADWIWKKMMYMLEDETVAYKYQYGTNKKGRETHQ